MQCKVYLYMSRRADVNDKIVRSFAAPETDGCLGWIVSLAPGAVIVYY